MYTQLRGHIKGGEAKYILQKFLFYSWSLKEIWTNLADIFIKILSILTFEKLKYKIGMCHLRVIKWCLHINTCFSLFLLTIFYPIEFFK